MTKEKDVKAILSLSLTIEDESTFANTAKIREGLKLEIGKAYKLEEIFELNCVDILKKVLFKKGLPVIKITAIERFRVYKMS